MSETWHLLISFRIIVDSTSACKLLLRRVVYIVHVHYLYQNLIKSLGGARQVLLGESLHGLQCVLRLVTEDWGLDLWKEWCRRREDLLSCSGILLAWFRLLYRKLPLMSPWLKPVFFCDLWFRPLSSGTLDVSVYTPRTPLSTLIRVTLSRLSTAQCPSGPDWEHEVGDLLRVLVLVGFTSLCRVVLPHGLLSLTVVPLLRSSEVSPPGEDVGTEVSWGDRTA